MAEVDPVKLCGLLIPYLVDGIKFLREVGDEVGDVQQELKRLQLLLEEVDRSKYKEKSVLYFFKRMREFSHRIENVVDKYEAEVVLGKQEKGVINRVKRIACSICECISLCEVGEEIVTIKKDIPKLEKEITQSKNRKSEISVEDDGEEITFGVKVQKDFVGKEKDIDLLVAELLNGANNVVSICGMGGLGKTTLAREIYHHKDIRSGFQAFAWGCVSQVCKPKRVLRDLLGDLLKDAERENMSLTTLVQEVHKVLQEQKCLIVVDDIWEVADWRRLKDAFPLDAKNSKVLFTTRKASVAGLGFFHSLGFLSEDDAWKLLRKKAFNSGDPKDLSVELETLEKLGREMVKKCGYLPSAIEVLGDILKSNDWETINKDIDLLSRTRSSADREIKEVLSLSYYDLPHHLKPCFLYMSQFQGNIRPERLYLLWIAEGLVSPNDQEKNETLIDVAERFLGELASRSMVQVKIDETIALKESKSCWLHNLWRDWCLAKSEEEEFLYFMDFRDGKRPLLIHPPQRLVVYLDINFNAVSLIGQSSQSLRSLFIHGPHPQNPIALQQGVIDFDDLKFLRVLNFENVDFKGNKLLEKIGELIHLRMLGFKSCILSELPSCIGNLPFLHTLLLEALVEISCIICKIKQLRYLDVRGGSFPGKLALSNLDKLERFYGFDSRTCEIMDLSKLPNLRRLQALIDGNENLSKFIDWIKANGKGLDYIGLEIFNCEFLSEQGMAILSKVSMTCNIGCIILRNSPIGKLPKYEAGFFPSLTVLNLVGCEILEDPMDTLEKLPKLTELGLQNSYSGEEMICHAKGFAQLRKLTCDSLEKLEKWTVEKGAMPCLSYLHISNCVELRRIPDGIGFCPFLQKLEFFNMPSEFRVKLAKGGEDFDKICHVNSVTISDD